MPARGAGSTTSTAITAYKPDRYDTLIAVVGAAGTMQKQAVNAWYQVQTRKFADTSRTITAGTESKAARLGILSQAVQQRIPAAACVVRSESQQVPSTPLHTTELCHWRFRSNTGALDHVDGKLRSRQSLSSKMQTDTKHSHTCRPNTKTGSRNEHF
ncbi:hypothetical protein ABBQ38_006984 [Trebouxia sp. C0009 RCD-2024]